MKPGGTAAFMRTQESSENMGSGARPPSGAGISLLLLRGHRAASFHGFQVSSATSRDRCTSCPGARFLCRIRARPQGEGGLPTPSLQPVGHPGHRQPSRRAQTEGQTGTGCGSQAGRRRTHGRQPLGKGVRGGQVLKERARPPALSYNRPFASDRVEADGW